MYNYFGTQKLADMEETELNNQTICVYCNANEIDDEFHLILFVIYIHLLNRQKYINKKYWKNPSVHKLLSMLNSSKKNGVLNLCIYIHKFL